MSPIIEGYHPGSIVADNDIRWTDFIAQLTLPGQNSDSIYDGEDLKLCATA